MGWLWDLITGKTKNMTKSELTVYQAKNLLKKYKKQLDFYENHPDRYSADNMGFTKGIEETKEMIKELEWALKILES